MWICRIILPYDDANRRMLDLLLYSNVASLHETDMDIIIKLKCPSVETCPQEWAERSARMLEAVGFDAVAARQFI
jgi:hypothetical protein